jgi:predicted dehydrogenase
MSHQIPTLKALVNTIGDSVEKKYGHTERTKTKLLHLFDMLKKWKAASQGRRYADDEARTILEFANAIMDAHGIEYLSPAEGDRDYSVYGGNGASYVNIGDTYDGTLLYDEKKQNFYATSWGDFVEQAERRGRKF